MENTLYGNVRATSISKEELVSVLRQLSLDARELDVGSSVPMLEHPPSALQFCREYVGPNRPVLVRGAVSEWPALALWNEEYLIRALGPTPLTMATTPNGRADALVPGPDGSALDPDTGNPVFALPMESKVDVATFYQCLRRRDGASPVPYLQYQNSSLSVEAPQLLVDVAPELGWASEAFGNQPEAVNLWVGDERSVTSWHRDPYENMYVVVNGAKRFHLLAPADGWRMAVRRAEVHRWEAAGPGPQAGLELRPTGEATAWSSVTPPGTGRGEAGIKAVVSRAAEAPGPGAPGANSDAPGHFADPFLPPPLEVEVGPGETLYLPAGWWHAVEQSPDTIAVNYWHDRHWGAGVAAATAVESLAVLAGLSEA
uniref:JmjC domain-containing protein n=1 Tax=Auxenochlorella protothecoides TaxID=3075 RepID=A0A1D1ZN93_AUXPR